MLHRLMGRAIFPGPIYTPGVRAVHKTEHLSAVFGSITPEIHTHLRHAVHPLAEKSLTQCAWAEIYYRRHREKGQSHADTLRRLGQRWLKIIPRYGKIRVLMVMRDFHGWDTGALWEDIKWDAKHFNDVERVAIVGEKKWQQWLVAFCKPFTRATVRYFDQEKLDEARA